MTEVAAALACLEDASRTKWHAYCQATIPVGPALKFGREGAIVIVCDLDQPSIDETVVAVKAVGADAQGFIVDVTNRFNPQNPAAAVDGSSMSEHIQTLAPHSHVTKAFNYAFASKMADPRADGTAIGPADGQRLVLHFLGHFQPGRHRLVAYFLIE